MPRKIQEDYEDEDDIKEDEKPSRNSSKKDDSEFRIVTENQLLNAKLDHAIELMEKILKVVRNL